MKKINLLFLLFFYLILNVYADIPSNVYINNNTIIYNKIDNTKLQLIITIDNIQYYDEYYYAYYEEENRIDIPIPKYLCTYRDAVILLNGTGNSYRDLIVYQKRKNKIIKQDFENSLSMLTLPRTMEKYIIIYNQNPILIFNDETISFYKINKKIYKDIQYIEIDNNKFIIFYKDDNFEELKY